MHVGTLGLNVDSRRETRRLGVVIPAGLLLVAAAGWWWSARMAPGTAGAGMTRMHETMALGGFVVAWVAMMAAMMLPAVLPVVKLYAHAAARGRAAPTAFFVLGYLAVWAAIALPAYFAWRALAMPLQEGQAWVGRLAGATFLAAAAWQLTPIKSMCLRHCRSPLGFFLRFGGGIARPRGAARMGLAHGAFCFGCCWAIFAVLVVLGTMNLLWMVLLTVLIVAERNAPRGQLIGLAGGAALAAVGAALLIDGSLLVQLT